MSSSIDPARRQGRLLATVRRGSSSGSDGQIIVLFALALFVIFAIAALVYDVGQSFVDRRTEQNVADAGALAAARYLPSCPSPQTNVNCPTAVNAAIGLATSQGYTDGVNGVHVAVKIPPGGDTEFAGVADTVEVAISSTRGSIFGGVLGRLNLGTGALGVAQNSTGYTLPYSLLMLDPTSCGTNKITGNGGGITTGGTVHVDSNCPTQAVLLSGGGVLTAPECDVVGTVQVSGGAVDNCTKQPSGVTVFGDPLRELPPPPQPAAPAAVVRVSGNKPIPSACPGGSSPATAASPAVCQFNANGSVFRLFPGFYPGGLSFQAGTFYLEPGIYWLGGGGYSMSGSGASVMSVATGGTTFGGGVLFYRGQDPDPTIKAACATTPGGPGCYAGWSMQGASASIQFSGLQSGPYAGMVIYVDRGFAGATVTLNGSSTNFTLTGTVYAPTAFIKVNGNGATSLSAQFIAYDIQVNGNAGVLNVPYAANAFFHLKGIGLVQ